MNLSGVGPRHLVPQLLLVCGLGNLSGDFVVILAKVIVQTLLSRGRRFLGPQATTVEGFVFVFVFFPLRV